MHACMHARLRVFGDVQVVAHVRERKKKGGRRLMRAEDDSVLAVYGNRHMRAALVY